MNLKKKLAIFDFDNTIKQHAPGFSTGGGMAEFFPDKKIPVEIFQVWKDQGFDAFCSTLISETNKLKISKDVLVKVVESDGELIKGKPEQFHAKNYISNKQGRRKQFWIMGRGRDGGTIFT